MTLEHNTLTQTHTKWKILTLEHGWESAILKLLVSTPDSTYTLAVKTADLRVRMREDGTYRTTTAYPVPMTDISNQLWYFLLPVMMLDHQIFAMNMLLWPVDVSQNLRIDISNIPIKKLPGMINSLIKGWSRNGGCDFRTCKVSKPNVRDLKWPSTTPYI